MPSQTPFPVPKSGCNAGPDARRCQFRRASSGVAGRFEKLVGLARQIQDRDSSCSSFRSIRWSASEARMSCRKILASAITSLHCSMTESLVSGLAHFTPNFLIPSLGQQWDKTLPSNQYSDCRLRHLASNVPRSLSTQQVARWTSSAADLTASFSLMRVRWVSIVLTLRPNRSAIFRVLTPWPMS